MAKIVKTEYKKPAPAAKPNPYIEDLAPIVAEGVDTAFAVETTAGEYAGEKLLIQKAVNAHGFTAREVETDFVKDSDPATPVTSTFVIRPARKSKGSAGTE